MRPNLLPETLVAPVLLLVVLVGGVAALSPSFLSPYSFSVLASEASALLALAAGQCLVVLLGGIDLASAALASLASVLIAIAVPGWGVLGIAGAVLIVAALGGLQGLAHVVAQVPSFVVTLAGLGIWSGIALTIAPATVPIAGDPVLDWLATDTAGVPHSFLLALALLGAAGFGLERLPFGRYVRAIGHGERAALLSGVEVRRVKVVAFATSGFCAGIAGLILAARLSSGSPTLAHDLLLPSIAAVIVGGTSTAGGVGGIGRTLVGGLIIEVLRSGVALTGLSPALEPIAYGALVVAAAAVIRARSQPGAGHG